MLHSLNFSFAEVVVLIDNQQNVTSDDADGFGSSDTTAAFAELVQSLAGLLHEGVISRVSLIDHSEDSVLASFQWFFGKYPELPSSARGFYTSRILCADCTGSGFFIQQLSILQQCRTRYCTVFGSDILASRSPGASSWVSSTVAMLQARPQVVAAVAPVYCEPPPELRIGYGFSDRYYLIDRRRFDDLMPVFVDLPSPTARQHIVFEEAISQHLAVVNQTESIAWTANEHELSVLHPPDERQVIEAMFAPFEATPGCASAASKQRCARGRGAVALASLGRQNALQAVGCQEPYDVNVMSHAGVARELGVQASLWT
eukprot:TRINITY_DN6422_c0_g2_i1.p1 TRINITY_DN6422_c0_g2~~TRINITY_DN6422_c0_g2_i1.p1  ORF type:complete len:326 (-),score=68.63 TRINITY_DN6422_c0_g2_i1:253-1200(-)